MRDLPSAERIRSVLSYDPIAGHLTWVATGKRAGCLYKNGYVLVDLDGVRMRAHRIAWLLAYGEWPETDVDHRDTVKSHNWLSNLRLASASLNIANTSARKTNKSGFKGVSWHRRAGKWQASIMVNRKSMGLGLFPTPEEASVAYQRAAEKHFGEFARA